MSCSVEMSMKSFIASEPRLCPKELWILSAMALSVHVVMFGMLMVVFA